ncbi:MAG TPA: HAMP domain-containing protein, partial [Polyangiaceae bacterium]|nr:HAMP domain-containing protein [Polyangiaceae bacterium]
RQVKAMEELTLSRARLAATLGARVYGAMLEEGIDTGYLTVRDAFDHDYQPIKGYDWGSIPRYHSKFDFFTDTRAVALQETAMQSNDVLYAMGMDTSGYVPTHNVTYQKRPSGDVKQDMANNRTKRIFTGDVAGNAAKSEAPVLVQDYVRDTGQPAWDVSAPISVKGKHWGAFRVGISVDEVQKLANQLRITLLGVFVVFAVGAIGSMALMVRSSMRPLVSLTQLADEISMGEKLDAPVKLGLVDEVGQMAKSIERLRSSLQAAMSRLGE